MGVEGPGAREGGWGTVDGGRWQKSKNINRNKRLWEFVLGLFRIIIIHFIPYFPIVAERERERDNINRKGEIKKKMNNDNTFSISFFLHFFCC
jgi:hypothetical protein